MAAPITFGDSGQTFGEATKLFGGGDVADRWYRDNGASGEWGPIASFYDLESAGSAVDEPTATDNALFSDTAQSGNCFIGANKVCLNLYTASADSGGSDNWTGTLDIRTYNLDASGEVKIGSGATLDTGASAGTGLSVQDLTFLSGSSWVLEIESNIVVSRHYLMPLGEVVKSTGTRGNLHLTGSGNFDSNTSGNRSYSILQDAGAITTLVRSAQVTAAGSDSTTINGTFVCVGYTLTTGCSAAGSYTFGAAADVTGSGIYNIQIVDGATHTWSRATAITFTGLVNMQGDINGSIAICEDFSNSNFQLGGAIGSVNEHILDSGTLKCINFSIDTTASYLHTVTNTTNNPSFEFSGDVDFNINSGTLTYTKGSGTITLAAGGATKTIDFQSKAVEDVVVADTADIKQFVETFTTDSFTAGTGTVVEVTNGKTLTTTGNATLSGTLRSTSAGSRFTLVVGGVTTANGADFKDVDASANPFIAYSSTDSGNNLGITFADPIDGSICLQGAGR